MLLHIQLQSGAQRVVLCRSTWMLLLQRANGTGLYSKKKFTSMPSRGLERNNKSLLIVGLGNWQNSLKGTRHNIGMIMLDDLIDKKLDVSPLEWKMDKSAGGLVASYSRRTRTNDDPIQIIFLKPASLMNISGHAVKKAATKFNIRPEQIILVHDDLERSLGKVSWKGSGSASGHNGVRSVLDVFKTMSIPRIRVGIGRPEDRDAVASFVLSDFTADETTVIRDTVAPLFVKQLDQAISVCAA